MKENYRFEQEYQTSKSQNKQEYQTSKSQNKQEVIEFILNKDYGETLSNYELAKMLKYNIDDEEEYHKFKTMMSSIRKFLLRYGRVLKSISGVGYYILKPSQISQHCYRTYIKGAARMFDKSQFVLERTDKSELNETRIEEIQNIMELNKNLIENTWNAIEESKYYSRKNYYDSLEEQ